MSIEQDRLAQPVMVARGRSLPTYLATSARGLIATRELPLLVRWSFLLLIGAIACDVLPIMTATRCGALFFAIYLFYHNPFVKRSFPSISPVVVWFVIYVAVYALHGFFLPTEYLSAFFERLFSLVQSIIFVWIASDIMEDEKMATKALLAYSIASVIAALGLVFSLPGFAGSEELGIERTGLIGTSPTSLAFAMVMVLGVWRKLPHKGPITYLWMFVSMLALSTVIVYSGTRNAFLAAMIGVSVYLFPYWRRRWRISHVIVGAIAMAGLVYIAANSPVFHERWQAFVKEGDLSSRDTIFQEALDMISERPLIGWQPIQFEYELGSRTGYSVKAAHNLYLHLFMEVGIVGAVPFLVGLGLCGQRAWKARNRNLGLLPLAVLVTMLAAGMGGNIISTKLLWFALAVTVAAGEARKRQGIVVGGRLIQKAAQASSLKSNSSMPGRMPGVRSRKQFF